MTLAFKNFVKRTFENQILEKWSSQRLLVTRAVETYDGDDGMTATTDSQFYIDGFLGAITEKDRQMLEMGFAEVGDSHGYFKEADGIINKDIILSISTGKEYKVSKIVDDADEIHGFECFTHGILRYLRDIS